jgi:arginine:pyruvate transaminase
MRYASISDRLSGLGGDKWAVHLAGRARAAAGHELIFLSIGEPDLPPPAAVVATAIDSLRAGRTKYAAGRGEAAALKAIAEHYSRRSGATVLPSQIVYTAGTQNALAATMTTLVEAGDEVLVPDPHYATYEGVVAATGAAFVPVPTLPADGFHLTPLALEARITDRSRVLLLNTPGNPTGAVLSAAEIDAIGEVCMRHDLWIVCDEVYADITFDAPFASPFDRPQLRDRSVSVSSISKSHALPGFRSGWAAGPVELADRLTTVVETMLFGSQPFLADALVAALTVRHPEVDRLAAEFHKRAEVLVAALAAYRSVGVRMPEGGMFCLLDVRSTGLSGEAFAWRLLDEEQVVVMPGESFGAGGAGHVRIALTVEPDVIVEACRRIGKLAARLAADREDELSSTR